MSSQTWRGKREKEIADGKFINVMREMREAKMAARMGSADTLYDRKSNTKDDWDKFDNYISEPTEPEVPDTMKVLQVELRVDFEKELNNHIRDGWKIHPGESLKIFNRVYTILLTREIKVDKSYI